MKSLKFALGLGLAIGVTGVCHGQTPVTGTVPAGSYTFVGDVVVYDVTIASGPLGERTLTIKVIDGSITVGLWPYSGGINGAGIDGQDGADGQPGVLPTAGQPGRGAFDVVLETWPGTGSSAALDINITKPIDCTGGNGGRGGNGASAYFDDCEYKNAQYGATARPGEAGGIVTIRSSGNISISAAVDVSGGNGGAGGSAGGGIIGAPGYAMPGGMGGGGGEIKLEHTASAPPTATCTVATGNFSAAYLGADGGDGGAGGSGATGNGAAHPGANGGAGGSAGKINVLTRNFGLTTTNINLGSTATSRGGDGGPGGDGGAGSTSHCYSLDCSLGHFEYPIGACAGANAGLGAKGGLGGPVKISVNDQAGLGLRCGVLTHGGNGATTGIAGQGAIYKGTCGEPLPCTAFSAYSAGSTFESGDGGGAGSISVVAQTLSLDPSAGMNAIGGHGAEGTDASNPGFYCCGTPPVKYSAAGSQGGGGGRGGSGAGISLAVTTLNAALSQFRTCGGDGNHGGNGSYGLPRGVGGVGTYSGVSGKLIKNGVVQPNGCVISHWPDGGVGPDLPPCPG
jgi:hypothetical protein